MVPRFQIGIGVALLLLAQMLPPAAYAVMLTPSGAPDGFPNSLDQRRLPSRPPASLVPAALDVEAQGNSWTVERSGTSGGENMPVPEIALIAHYGVPDGALILGTQNDADPGASPVPVPEPLWLLGAGAIALWCLGRHRSARALPSTVGGVT